MARLLLQQFREFPSKGNVACLGTEAFMFSIQTAQQTECVPMIIESDSTEVVDLCLDRKGSKTEIPWTITETQTSLKGQNWSSIQFVARGCNAITRCYSLSG